MRDFRPFYDFNTVYGSWFRRRKTVFWLVLFFGCFGVHRMYLGKFVHGLLMLLLTLLFIKTGIPIVIALLDGIRLLTMSPESFYNAYNSETQPLKLSRFSGATILIPVCVLAFFITYATNHGFFEPTPQRASENSVASEPKELTPLKLCINSCPAGNDDSLSAQSVMNRRCRAKCLNAEYGMNIF